MFSWIYESTQTGKSALSDNASGLPVHYRRILVLVEGPTHSNVLRGALRCYSERELRDWLAELDTLGLIQVSRVTEKAQEDLDYTNSMSRAEITSRLRLV
jgi:hypothetical protein